ncbi:MAG: CooT family nickel-binding protein [Candidatus Electronema sp. VV]|jgi:predicted RNA-binding protein|uniref:CooT family nickel-binding protein n=1 Tax=Candidatus Electronema sp. JC TaxID=3401570 RepID=UPI003AA87B4B
MCQLKAVVERQGSRETVMESVTGVDVTADGVVLSTYFEEPLTLRGVRIRSVDLLNGAILLMEQNTGKDR